MSQRCISLCHLELRARTRYQNFREILQTKRSIVHCQVKCCIKYDTHRSVNSCGRLEHGNPQEEIFRPRIDPYWNDWISPREGLRIKPVIRQYVLAWHMIYLLATFIVPLCYNTTVLTTFIHHWTTCSLSIFIIIAQYWFVFFFCHAFLLS